jgi:predicted amidophosphoribosyltransferase
MAEHRAEPPPDDDNTTTPTATTPPHDRPLCPVCWTPFRRIGRQRFCSDNCRKTAWARSHQATPRPVEPVPPPGRRRDATVYSCPSCDVRYHARQWCPDCNQPCTRVGIGGLCPHCDEPVAITDLLDAPQPATMD